MKKNSNSDAVNPINRCIHRFNRFVLAALATAMLMVSMTNVRADAAPFSRIYVFGDSLSDTGNFYTLTGGYPPPPYAGGRFSNGKVWVEYTADALGMSIQSGGNFAVAGATTGRYNVNNGLAGLTFPGLQDQIDSFQASQTPQDASEALFIVWAGANDIFAGLVAVTPPQVTVTNGVYNTALAVLRLKQSGAQHILVVNVPDLGVTPFAQGTGFGAQISQLSAAYNATL